MKRLNVKVLMGWMGVILGILITLLAFQIDRAEDFSWTRRLLLEDYSHASNAIHKMLYEQYTLQPDDEGFSQLNAILEEIVHCNMPDGTRIPLDKLPDSDHPKVISICVTSSMSGMGAGVMAAVLQATFDGGQKYTIGKADLESLVEDKYRHSVLFKGSYLILLIGMLITLLSHQYSVHENKDEPKIDHKRSVSG
jgi:hypothetical protein